LSLFWIILMKHHLNLTELLEFQKFYILNNNN
jgi:hypothetical protein